MLKRANSHAKAWDEFVKNRLLLGPLALTKYPNRINPELWIIHDKGNKADGSFKGVLFRLWWTSAQHIALSPSRIPVDRPPNRTNHATDEKNYTRCDNARHPIWQVTLLHKLNSLSNRYFVILHAESLPSWWFQLQPLLEFMSDEIKRRMLMAEKKRAGARGNVDSPRSKTFALKWNSNSC